MRRGLKTSRTEVVYELEPRFLKRGAALCIAGGAGHQGLYVVPGKVVPGKTVREVFCVRRQAWLGRIWCKAVFYGHLRPVVGGWLPRAQAVLH